MRNQNQDDNRFQTIFNGVKVGFGIAVLLALLFSYVHGQESQMAMVSEVISLLESEFIEPKPGKELILDTMNRFIGFLGPGAELISPDVWKFLSADAGSIGIALSKEKQGLMVVTPLVGSSAMAQGVAPDDLIVSIDHQPAAKMTLFQAIAKIRGAVGSSVSLTIQLPNGHKPRQLELVRQKTSDQTVWFCRLNGSVGYIRVSGFDQNTPDRFRAALKSVMSGWFGLKGLILDLRYNPGGSLESAVAVADTFIEKGTLTTVKGHGNRFVRTYPATRNRLEISCPIIVLINRGTGYEAEVVAAAFKDHQRALVLGQATAGQGVVWKIMRISQGYRMRLPTGRYYRPHGKLIQGIGVEPHFKLDIWPNADAARQWIDPDVKEMDKDPWIQIAMAIIGDAASSDIDDLTDAGRRVLSQGPLPGKRL